MVLSWRINGVRIHIEANEASLSGLTSPGVLLVRPGLPYLTYPPRYFSWLAKRRNELSKYDLC